MKKLLMAVTVIAIVAGGGISGWAIDDYGAMNEKKDKPIVAQCPETKMTESCLVCHTTPDFKRREIKEDNWREYPNSYTKIKDGVGHYLLMTINSYDLEDSIDYFLKHDVKEWVIEVHSPGGSLFEAWRIIGMMSFWKAHGITIETRCNGFAASAGFMVFISGSRGHRFVNPFAELMWHEAMMLEWIKLQTASSKETEADEAKHIQKTANSYVLSRANPEKLTMKDLEERVHFKNYWLTGKTAVELGLADGFLNE